MKCDLCGDIGTPSKRRSTEQHRRFFSLVKAAFDNWPSDAAFQPDTPLHLRKWLTCKSEWRHVLTIENPNFAKQAADVCLALLHQRGEPGWITQIGGKLAVISARSIAYSDMPHKDACRVFEYCEYIICEILKLKTGDQLLKETKS